MSAPQEAKASSKHTKKVRIALRAAVAEDVIELWHLLQAYFAEGTLKHKYPAPVPMPTIAWGLKLIAQRGVIVAFDQDTGKIVGTIATEVFIWPWAPEHKYLNGIWFYVQPERRAGGTADRLIEAVKEVAAKNNMAVLLQNVWGVDVELQDRFRQKHGMTNVGGNHLWFPPSLSDGHTVQ